MKLSAKIFTVFIPISDSLYPFCAISNSYVLGPPEVIIGPAVKNFVWGAEQLFLKNDEGSLIAVEGLLLVRVVLPRSIAPQLRGNLKKNSLLYLNTKVISYSSGIPFLPRKFRDKSVTSECNLCLINDNRLLLCKHNDYERSFVEVYTIYELVICFRLLKSYPGYQSKHVAFRFTQDL